MIVSGAAAGIGRSVVERLLRDDPAVHCVAIDRADDALARLAKEYVGRVTSVTADLATPEGLATVAGAIDGLAVPVDGLVNAAGNSHTGDSIDLTLEDLRAVFAVHVEATLGLSQIVARAMVSGGSIVNFSSVAGGFGWPRRLPYAISKAAVEAMTRTLASEWAARGIRVNAVAPGYVNTDMIRSLAAAGAFDVEQRLGSQILGRFADPDEIASVVVFLLGAGASYVVGQVINVDGGFTVTKDVHPIDPR